jgi:tetratricopeptide (TPR) repeat protein
VHAGHDNLEAAVRHYRQALEIQERMPPTTDRARAMERLETRAQIINGIMAAGAQHFQDHRYEQAANAFRDVTRIEPNSRDAWYNLALALYQLERWNDLEPVAERVVELDPLNYNARVILFNAHRGMAAEAPPGTPAEHEATARGLATLEAADALPVQIDGISLSGGVDTPVRIVGAATDSGQAGAPVTLEFAVYGASGELGSAITTIERPGPDATLPFSVSIRTAEPVTGWRYRLR